jgi:alanine-glyoxylate transaminase/serine-glyoxylate transaminase/serine-pyruvate transaminase
MASETKSSSRPLLVIPGPTEYHEDVLKVLGEQSPGHVAPSFIEEFGATLQMFRQVLLTKDAQPVILAGSGTLGWDVIVANFLQPGEVLVVNTGYFSDSFASCCKAYGVAATEVKAAVGSRPEIKEIESALGKADYQMLCITHVDTSTSVINDIKAIAAAARKVKPNILIAVDGVCSFGGEEFRFDDWGIDCAMTCSQKALGCPPGLCLMAFSKRALEVMSKRKTKFPCYFTNLENWIPIMQKYEAREAAYFATPPVNLIRAQHVSLKRILSVGVDQIFKQQAHMAQAFRAALTAMNLTVVPVQGEFCANTLTAIRFPKGVTRPDLLPKLLANGITAAGGLHKAIKDEYFRIGHMGISATEPKRGHIRKVVEALETSMSLCGHAFPQGAALKKFDSFFTS